jgi:hypothetical protein
MRSFREPGRQGYRFKGVLTIDRLITGEAAVSLTGTTAAGTAREWRKAGWLKRILVPLTVSAFYAGFRLAPIATLIVVIPLVGFVNAVADWKSPSMFGRCRRSSMCRNCEG